MGRKTQHTHITTHTHTQACTPGRPWPHTSRGPNVGCVPLIRTASRSPMGPINPLHTRTGRTTSPAADTWIESSAETFPSSLQAGLSSKRGMASGYTNVSSVHSHLTAPLEAHFAFDTMRCRSTSSPLIGPATNTWHVMTAESSCTLQAHSHCHLSSHPSCCPATWALRWCSTCQPASPFISCRHHNPWRLSQRHLSQQRLSQRHLSQRHLSQWHRSQRRPSRRHLVAAPTRRGCRSHSSIHTLYI